MLRQEFACPYLPLPDMPTLLSFPLQASWGLLYILAYKLIGW
ncbi:hypothetical protein J2T17_001018 [Paenibacillus mucilaginosus]